MSQKANYFKIGLFVILGFIILIGAILFLATGGWFEQPVYVETYFNESVEGLDIGSPATFRGVKIGKVDKIDFTASVYGIGPDDPEYFKKGRYVYVRIRLVLPSWTGYSEEERERILGKMIEDGLRIQLDPQGITGLVQLQAEYFDPEKNPPMEISWEPKHRYVPSTPSLFAKVSDALGSLADRVNDLDIEGTVNGLNQFLSVATDTMREADIDELSEDAQGLLEGLRETNRRVQDLLAAPELEQMPKDLSQSVAGLRRIVEGSENDVESLLASLDVTMAQTAEISRRIGAFVGDASGESANLEKVGTILENVRVASEEFPQTVAALNQAVQRASRMLAVQRGLIDEILLNLRGISENLATLTENAKHHPSGILFGEPPTRSEIDKQ